MKTAYIFSGQGAQTVGMGKDLYEQSNAAAAIFNEADSVLGWSISDICFNGPAEKLTESKYCQPAIYTTSMACLAAYREKFDGDPDEVVAAPDSASANMRLSPPRDISLSRTDLSLSPAAPNSWMKPAAPLRAEWRRSSPEIRTSSAKSAKSATSTSPTTTARVRS